MARARRTTPAGHGELLTQPDASTWADLTRANAAAAAAWSFPVAGIPASELRRRARHEAVAASRELSNRMSIPVAELPDEPGLLVVTGHQPELYHPGVWVKDFLLERLASETGAAALDLVVDSDGFSTVEMHSPCLKPEVRVCSAYLAVGTDDGCYGCAPVPDRHGIEDFIASGMEHLATLPAPAIGHHFERFGADLRAAAGDARNLAELVTFARRRYEASAGSSYSELMVSALAATSAFRRFALHVARDAARFAAVYNDALGDYRERTATRSAAQPFPDLAVEADRIELPFWSLEGPRRRRIWVRTAGEGALVSEGALECDLGGTVEECLERLDAADVRLAPKALALTLFARMFVADFFIHGVGGGRYDQVTDDVIRRYFGVEPPAFAVASLTMYLPLGAQVVRDEEVEALSMALNRLRQNPDQMLDEVEFDTAAERERADALAARKAALVAAIATPDADKKAIGAEIRSVNGALAALMEPIEVSMHDELARLEQLRESSGILTDRTYPFCLWDPAEIADKVR